MRAGRSDQMVAVAAVAPVEIPSALAAAEVERALSEDQRILVLERRQAVEEHWAAPVDPAAAPVWQEQAVQE